MTTVSDLRATGSTVTNVATPIVEPISAPTTFSQQLSRFGENYSLASTSHLYKFLVALCGEAGAGALKKELMLPRLEQQLAVTHFDDLDKMYGSGLSLPRLSIEVYAYDPKNQTLASSQWQEVRSKDAAYRERCLIWMRAIMEGPTPTGMKLAGQAALGVECDIFERYQYIENLSADIMATVPNIGSTNSLNEFVIIPRMPATTDQERRRVKRLVDKLRPINTIPSVYDGDYLRSEQPVTDVGSTTNRFDIRRYVTGRSDIQWPAIDLNAGYWVVSSDEQEAPTFAFMERQESSTSISISSATSSTEHVGPFNLQQATLFANLSKDVNSTFVFSKDNAYAAAVAPVSLSIPWTGSVSAPRDTIIVNNHYPVGYFAQENVDSFGSESQNQFWASEEKFAPANDTLTFDFGLPRPINFIDFEITQKPIDFSIAWSLDNTNWTAVTPIDTFPTTLSVPYLPSNENPWHYFEMHFGLVTARYVRIIFTRRQERFPLITSDYFPYSIDVRGLHLVHAISSADTFISDAGVDILGNSFRTDIEVYDPGNVIDDDIGVEPTYWQSQPNPSSQAVEALYFDLRTGLNVGTMAYEEEWSMADLNTRSMSDLQLFYEDGIVIDEVYIDPITFGPDMHIYYSLDDTPDWDNKLWIPVPRNYILKKGFHALPSPTFVKYMKLEFCNLTAIPYQTLEYPNMPPVTFRRYPTWVQNYFNELYPSKSLPDALQVFDAVQIDPLIFGFQKPIDKLDSNYELMRTLPSQLTDSEVEIKAFIDQLVANQQPKEPQRQVEDQINVRTPVMWQDDLLDQLNLAQALSRKAREPRAGITDTGFTAELGLPVYEIPVTQSVADLTASYQEKKSPTMFFPRKCRHGYQVIQAPLTNKIAYFVAIKSVNFYRRDYTVDYDEAFYVETLGDDSHVEVNEFTDGGWRYIIS